MTINLAVLASAVADEAWASSLSATLRLPLAPMGAEVQALDNFDAVLIVQGTQLLMQQCGHSAPGPVSVDFGSGAMRHRRKAGANELLGKAVGVGKKSLLRVLDATAGLGRDSFVLADLGCDVSLYERHPVVAQLLSAGLVSAASSSDSWQQQVVAHMHLHPIDPRHAVVDDAEQVDVIYLDPMFAVKDKAAAVKKEMALLQQLLSCPTQQSDAENLLHWALQQDVARVVVKRPAKGAALADVEPSHCIRGKAVRYDVHVFRKL